MLRLAIVAAVLAGQGCGPISVCDPVLSWGIAVEVRDSATGGKLEAAPTGIAILQGGSATIMETRERSHDHYLEGASNAGAYEVVITASGYRPWATRVEVEPNGSGCGRPAGQVQLNARMVRLGT